MADFTYKSTIYGPQVFTAPDGGGIVELNGKKLTTFGGYLTSHSSSPALHADAASLEAEARAWWKSRDAQQSALGHKANDVEP